MQIFATSPPPGAAYTNAVPIIPQHSTLRHVQYPVPPDLDITEKPWALPEQTSIVFVHANVVDPANERVLKDVTVKLKHGLVESVGKTSNESDMGLTVEELQGVVIDAKGFYMCPGLIDCHVHIMAVPGYENIMETINGVRDTAIIRSAWVLKNMLSQGFTTVRDVGGATKPQAEAVEQWLTPGPRLFQGGPVLSQTGGHGDSTDPYGPQVCCGVRGAGLGRLVDGVPDALRAARELMRKGADHIKITTSGGVGSVTDKLEATQLTKEEIIAITTTVKNMGGIITTSHCYTNDGIRHSIEAGVGGIEHGNLLDEPTAALMAEKGIYLTPTLAVHGIIMNPPFEKFLLPSQREKNAMVRDAGLIAVQNAEKAGVTVCYGSDLLGVQHAFQTQEFVVRAKVLPSPTVLKHATTNPAKLLKMVGKIGTIAPGAFADIIFLKANPLEDVTIIDRQNEYLLGVMKEGRVVRSRIEGLDVEVPLW
ncbi:hypothetical protein DACRYDRAFT_53221 [Dacryopinax primogenitus]|uniref:Amidohydrolase-related domain-containing protein n=1 Tax=Dacryopinax primogenitus (strain DJM 731) TaxID=1858805 RepID=M5FY02_DACPD|nr:uncharacterized protein DACRYDRAFT_53221 [Dacryopinax primogenitus]EJU01409.1 hypothetical protein DACRYDRAFT_53221 [Dacryopinax primogenitus]